MTLAIAAALLLLGAGYTRHPVYRRRAWLAAALVGFLGVLLGEV